MALRLTSSIQERDRTERVRKEDARRTNRPEKPAEVTPTRAVFENRVRVDQQPQPIDDATQVRLSESAKARQSEEERVRNSLSTAASFVNVAADATEQVNKLLIKARQTAEAIQNERIDSPLRQGLAEDAAAILEEIDTISANAKVNGQSVLNGNTQIVTLDPKVTGIQGEGSSAFALTNIPLNSQSLGISSLNADAFLSDTENSIDTIDRAQSQVFSARAGLGRSSESLSTFAEEFGAERAQEVRGERALQAENAGPVAEQVAEAIKDSTVNPEETNNLDSERVAALLEDDGEDVTPQLAEAKKTAETLSATL